MGEVSIDGSFWRAVAETEIHEGRPVRVLGTQPGGRYVAQIEIPAATYTETPIEPQEGVDESGDTNRQTVERTKNPLDMAEVKLILWSIE